MKLNLCQMLGVPEKVDCFYCGLETLTFFNEYDTSFNNCNINPGEWELIVSCEHCNQEFTEYLTLKIEPPFE